MMNLETKLKNFFPKKVIDDVASITAYMNSKGLKTSNNVFSGMPECFKDDGYNKYEPSKVMPEVEFAKVKQSWAAVQDYNKTAENNYNLTFGR